MPSGKRETERKVNAPVNTGPSPNSDARVNNPTDRADEPAQGSGPLQINHNYTLFSLFLTDCIFRSSWPTGGMVSQAGDDERTELKCEYGNNEPQRNESRPQVRHNFLSQMSGFFNHGYACHAGGDPKATAVGAVSFGTPVYKT
ncbi:hypothetical protein T07_9103 [Trichinella nelsoni]|uniref:Uncharacterized protein n=1 Tax=Trichinella nelsoni TaxID=6336 RepID=A0A0V0RG72_9BILA|nr:hypothetical protein T07_9103 [Trichinella nelsoni]